MFASHIPFKVSHLLCDEKKLPKLFPDEKFAFNPDWISGFWKSMNADDELLVGSGPIWKSMHETNWSDPEWNLPDVDPHEYLDDICDTGLGSHHSGYGLHAMVCCGRDLPMRPSHLTIVPQWASGG